MQTIIFFPRRVKQFPINSHLHNEFSIQFHCYVTEIFASEMPLLFDCFHHFFSDFFLLSISSCCLSKFLSAIHACSGRGTCGCCSTNASSYNARFVIASSQRAFGSWATTEAQTSPSYHFHRGAARTAWSDFREDTLPRRSAAWTISIEGGPEGRACRGKYYNCHTFTLFCWLLFVYKSFVKHTY